jgi:hypothetical protein
MIAANHLGEHCHDSREHRLPVYNLFNGTYVRDAQYIKNRCAFRCRSTRYIKKPFTIGRWPFAVSFCNVQWDGYAGTEQLVPRCAMVALKFVADLVGETNEFEADLVDIKFLVVKCWHMSPIHWFEYEYESEYDEKVQLILFARG